MHSVSESVEKTGKLLAYHKERAILAAIEQYFEGEEWTEGDAGELAALEVHPNGTEIFKMGDKQMIMFSPVQTHINIDGNSVFCKFSQEIKVLNGGDNDN